MTKDEFYQIASPERFLNISRSLDDEQRDILKYKISRLCIEELENTYNISNDTNKAERFYLALNCLSIIQPYRDRVPEYGIVYTGRPNFMTNELLKGLQEEAIILRNHAVVNFDQFITCAQSSQKKLIAELLEDSPDLRHLVNRYAGPCSPSFISNYIYYDTAGHCSKPHVDNAFTSITVMIALKHDVLHRENISSSFSFWTKMPRYDYRLKPGEISIFFGASALHGRTPVFSNEVVHSLLLSFTPIVNGDK